jgi:NAD(P)-dependent dehydrogenase (short-subunit alcohol dehydrogenase family)
MSYEGFDIRSKAILVTGGTSGIGLAIAKGLISAGAHVVVGSSSLAKVESARAELGDGNDAVQLDVTDETSVAVAVSHVVQKYQKLDAVVHAAGVISRGPSIDLPVAEFRRVVETNLTGNFIVAQAAARVMRNQTADARGQRGCIINIASLNAYVSLSEVLAYAASKSGVMALTRGLANEWGQFGIRVNGIAPGVFPTDLNRKLIENTPRGDWLKNHTPLARFGQIEELVGAAIYLISPASSFTTGETIIVDGGFLARGV